MEKFDYLVVGSGLYGAIFAHEAKAHGKSVLVVDKRPNIAGNIYTENVEGINVHKYGAHIFHTNNKKVWNYITQFAEFNRFTNSPVANYKGELYSLPFNMYTFNKMWGVVTPEGAAAKIEEQRKEIAREPRNLEEQAISLVGRDIYEKLIKGYTEKQWGRDCRELPSFIIKRLPVRLTFDNNYFNALYQGIPVGGYTKMIANLLDGIEVRLNTDYLENKAELDALADKVVYTGPIDAYFDYKLGTLEYRSVRFETETLDKPNFQGKSNYAITGLYFYPSRVAEKAKKVKPSPRGELEITALNDMYLNEENLNVQLLGRGFAWLDTGTMESLIKASNFISMVEEQQGVMISAPEEIAFRYGWINKNDLLKSAEKYGKSPYGKHLQAVAEGKIYHE